MDKMLYCTVCTCRSTPVKVLHTVLLGCCKYMLRDFLSHRSSQEKQEIQAKIKSFPSSGLNARVTGHISYYKSFVGRDFKAWMMMAIFIVASYLEDSQKHCWFQLAKVSYSVYTRIIMRLKNSFYCLFNFSIKPMSQAPTPPPNIVCPGPV